MPNDLSFLLKRSLNVQRPKDQILVKSYIITVKVLFQINLVQGVSTNIIISIRNVTFTSHRYQTNEAHRTLSFNVPYFPFCQSVAEVQSKQLT